MTKGIFITGTDTDVGKTIITAGLMHLLRSSGYNATYFKAALSGAEEKNGVMIPGDTRIVCEVSTLKEDFEKITPYIYKTPVSPHLAAKLEGNPISREKIKESYAALKERYEYIVAEGSGGIVCPLNEEDGEFYLLQDLIKDCNMNVIVVARAALGTINHTVLTVKYIESLGIEVKGIIINGYKDTLLCKDNVEVIKKLTKVPILGMVNWMAEVDEKDLKKEQIRTMIEDSIKIEDLINCMDVL